MGGGGGGGWGWGGVEPPHVTTCPYYNSKYLYVSAQATKSAPKWLSECLRNALNFQNFYGGACPQTPLGGLWAYAHSIIVVTVHIHRSESSHFYYLFSALIALWYYGINLQGVVTTISPVLPSVTAILIPLHHT